MNTLNVSVGKCKRCGTCCKKGGPSFHLEDKFLIEKGSIPIKDLYTIRAGELALDNVQGELISVSTDIIKIKGKGDNWTCMYFDNTQNSCTIYENRPVECRVLNCQDTNAITKIYAKNRLIRKDLIGNVTGLWELIDDHQKKCCHKKLKEITDELKKTPDEKNKYLLMEMIKYDIHLREVVVEKTGVTSLMLDFLFGRQLSHLPSCSQRNKKSRS